MTQPNLHHQKKVKNYLVLFMLLLVAAFVFAVSFIRMGDTARNIVEQVEKGELKK